ncbi:phage tail tube protein [Cognatiyoonia sp. IB215182]|uniref:phage tail tube protein n=1 Tax=Cognatiyoonia sp. IB215182 TaxID=3097353 RepID=UPI002A146D3A|nr:phage tail tube protein [Cognatiyoonia sp. IB215182]MDX8354357.1 hypothetical protein [Cognatiyoonia sp. IB215182]
MALKWRRKILLFLIEAAYGVDPNPTGANDAFLATDVQLSPMEGNDVSRELETPYLGPQPTTPTELHQRLSFKVELVGSGTEGTAPGWGPILRACGCAETVVPNASVTYNPVSDDHESGTFYIWIDSTLFRLSGSRGTVTMNYTAQGIPYLEFQFIGLYSKATETPRVQPDLSAFQKPLVASDFNTPTFTINGADFVMRSCMLNLGNQVEPRFLINAESILITDRSDVLETTVEAVPLTDFDPFTLARDQTTVPVALSHGREAGLISTLNIPTAQIQRPQGLESTQNIVEWPLRMVPLPTAGDDQWTLVLT